MHEMSIPSVEDLITRITVAAKIICGMPGNLSKHKEFHAAMLYNQKSSGWPKFQKPVVVQGGVRDLPVLNMLQ
ncbi:hypothetical protein TNCV_4307451 [Trichonephila clavipes]|nr:hypothetical protein TNCV_4307451 [Trichonephila clavipes]